MTRGSDTSKVQRLEAIPKVEPTQCELDGHVPQRALVPRSLEDLSSIMQVAAAEGWRVVPWGGGTMMDLGAPIHGVELVVRIGELNNILELNEANLTITVQAGVRWTDLQGTLSRTGKGYEVPLDPPFPEQATVGGVLASGISGPRQILHGAIRNLVLGLDVVSAQAETMSFGGKTVKNVAGLDLCKTYLGSLGTLGILAGATLRLKPLPTKRLTVLATGNQNVLWDLVGTSRGSSLYPSGLVCIPSESFQAMDMHPSDGTQIFAFGLEGTAKGVKERWGRLSALGKGAALARLEDKEAAKLWTKVQNLPVPPADFRNPLSLRATVPPARTRALKERLQKEMPHRLIVHPGTGEAWSHWDLDEHDLNPQDMVQRLREAVHGWDGHLVVTRAPLEWKRQLDVWGLNETTRALMLSLKARLDPKGILAPGRWGES